ncbi:MAG: DUF1559 domain-containing protein [Thermoguttaceae bacterium]
MERKRTVRFGFTLVELLVVVSIIAMLAGLMLVGVNTARESARRATCLNNQKQLGTAMQSFAASKERLPGMVERQLSNCDLSWCHLLLPYIGENKRYENALKNAGNVEGATPAPTSGLTIFVCTSSHRGANEPNLTYVVNAGPAHCLAANTVTYPPAYAGMDSGPPPRPKYDFANLSLFIDRRDANYRDLRTRVKLDAESIPDGLSNTILLTENVQGGMWANASSGATFVDSTAAVAPAPPTAAARVNIGNFGFLWGVEQMIGATNIGVNSNVAVPDMFGSPDYARPSSNHPGIVHILMADGSVRPLSNEVDPQNVYTAMFCPSDKDAVDLKTIIKSGAAGSETETTTAWGANWWGGSTPTPHP